jgi:NAD-dependent deacetylase
MHEVVCTGCHQRTPAQRTLARVAAGDEDPRCARWGNVLELGVVLFGKHLDASRVSLAR